MEEEQAQGKRDERVAAGSIGGGHAEVREEWETSDPYNEGRNGSDELGVEIRSSFGDTKTRA